MDENFKLRAALKSDEELQEYVDNREKYLPDSVDAAVAELQHRGVEFSDEELQVISEDMQARRAATTVPTSFSGFFYDPEKIKQVDDPNAPAFFSKRAIYGFSVLFSLLCGSIMLAMNVGKTENRNGVIWVILYGLGWFFGTLFLAVYFHFNSGFGFMLNILGTFPLNNFFWNRYLGSDTLYRVRPLWTALIIGIAITVLIVAYAVLMYGPDGLK